MMMSKRSARGYFSCATLVLLLAVSKASVAGEAAAERAAYLVTPTALARELADPDAGQRPLILEVGRGPEDDGSEFANAGHPPGAAFLPWRIVAARRAGLPNQIPPLAELEAALRLLGVNQNTRIVLYDRGAGLHAGRAWAVFDYAGLAGQTRLLDGQLAGWLDSDAELATGTAQARSPGTVALRPAPEKVLAGERVADLVHAAVLREPSTLPRLRILDARPPQEFSGEIAGDEVPRPGHIPGATSLFWRTTIGPDEAPSFKDEATLREMFAAAGATAGDELLVYCRTGGQAGHLYLTARMLGFSVRLYDGSFVDWSQAEERPVAR